MRRIVVLIVALLCLAACVTTTQLHYQSDYREASLNRTMDTGHDK